MATHSLNKTTVKFLCSYGGKIIPRHHDGKLRYQGGSTRVLSVSRSITYTELLSKISEICGMAVNLRCQLPTDDIDVLINVTSEEDLANLMEEYDLSTTAPFLKIHVFLSPIKLMKTTSFTFPPLSAASSSSSSGSSSRSRSPPSPSVNRSPENRSIRNNGCHMHRNQNHNQFYLIRN